MAAKRTAKKRPAKKRPTKKRATAKQPAKKRVTAKRKPKLGRPVKYDPKWPERLPQMFSQGESVPEVAAQLGICKDTFYEYCKQYPAFSDAYKLGRDISEAWWTRLGRLGAAGRVNVQPATWIFNMKNRFAWKDRHEHTTDAEGVGAGLVIPVAIDRSTWEENVKRQQELMLRAGAAGVGNGGTDSD